MDVTSSSPDDQVYTFESALKRLEEITELLERDELCLESAIKAYEEGVQLARLCMQRLNAAELRIQELSIE